MTDTETTPGQSEKRQAHLDRGAWLARAAAHESREVIRLIHGDADRKQAARAALHASRLAWDAMSAMIDGGAVVPAFETTQETSAGFDLAGLTSLDTPDAHELLELLTRAQAVAERVDAQRGHVVPASLPLGPGESRGTDLAETISEVVLRLRVECFGPAGRD